ncbi:hypothetical protein MAHJHV55_52540 [Mycobacterium avium subsp. hominissuis]
MLLDEIGHPAGSGGDVGGVHVIGRAGKPDYRWAKEQTEARPADDVHAAHVSA